MVKLKDVYPLYLNNEAKQPNADLEVTDKYTGEVAFRVAQADAATIDAGIQGAVDAAEPMARLPSYQRQPGWYVARPIVMPPRLTSSNRPLLNSRTSSGRSKRRSTISSGALIVLRSTP